MKELVSFHWRLLTGRATSTELEHLDFRHLLLGLGWTWIVGMGRWWDDPHAGLLQRLGVGSLLYVFVLAAVLWLFVAPLRPKRWSYLGALTYVTLTAAPALLYAIPVELWLGVDVAAKLNLGFLAVVAAWRVSLWVIYVRRTTGLSRLSTAVSMILPLLAVIVGLTILNLQRGIIQIMAGLRGPTAEDLVGEAFLVMGILSFYGALPALIVYGLQVAAVHSPVGETSGGDERETSGGDEETEGK